MKEKNRWIEYVCLSCHCNFALYYEAHQMEDDEEEHPYCPECGQDESTGTTGDKFFI